MTSNAETLAKLNDATNARDSAVIESLFTEDAHFESARLPIVADGRVAVAKGITDWLDLHTDYELVTLREFYAGDEAYNEWRFTATLKETGKRIETHGVDYLRFKDGLIEEKNSFRKFLF